MTWTHRSLPFSAVAVPARRLANSVVSHHQPQQAPAVTGSRIRTHRNLVGMDKPATAKMARSRIRPLRFRNECLNLTAVCYGVEPDCRTGCLTAIVAPGRIAATFRRRRAGTTPWPHPLAPPPGTTRTARVGSPGMTAPINSLPPRHRRQVPAACTASVPPSRPVATPMRSSSMPGAGASTSVAVTDMSMCWRVRPPPGARSARPGRPPAHAPRCSHRTSIGSSWRRAPASSALVRTPRSRSSVPSHKHDKQTADRDVPRSAVAVPIGRRSRKRPARGRPLRWSVISLPAAAPDWATASAGSR
jgi:hypothetical protein